MPLVKVVTLVKEERNKDEQHNPTDSRNRTTAIERHKNSKRHGSRGTKTERVQKIIIQPSRARSVSMHIVGEIRKANVIIRHH